MLLCGSIVKRTSHEEQVEHCNRYFLVTNVATHLKLWFQGGHDIGHLLDTLPDGVESVQQLRVTVGTRLAPTLRYQQVRCNRGKHIKLDFTNVNQPKGHLYFTQLIYRGYMYLLNDGER